MKYYAYIPIEDGREGCGTENKVMFESKGNRYALGMAQRRLGTSNFVLCSYTNFYDDKTFKTIKGEYKP